MTKHSKTNVNADSGVSLQTMSRFLACFGLILLFVIGVCLYRTYSGYRLLVRDYNQHMDSHGTFATFQRGSDAMTRLSGLFAVTQDPECMERYAAVVDSHAREDAHDTLIKYFTDKGYSASVKSIQLALQESDALMDTEIHAMKLITQAAEIPANQIPTLIADYKLPAEEEDWSREQKQDYATELVFGEAYRRSKDKIDADIVAATDAMSNGTEEDIDAGMKNLGQLITQVAVLCFLLAGIFISDFVVNHILVIWPIRRCIRCIQEKRRLALVGARELKYLAATYNDMFDANEAHQKHTEYLLEHDALTNATSKLSFEEHTKALALAPVPVGLLLFDVDHFKAVNDTYGHEAGDRALIRVVQVIRSLLRSRDIIARIGGDEFAALLIDIRAEDAAILGRKLDEVNQILQNPEDGSPKLSLSIGVSFSAQGYREEQFQQADQALYEAKEQGRCRYRIYHTEA